MVKWVLLLRRMMRKMILQQQVKQFLILLVFGLLSLPIYAGTRQDARLYQIGDLALFGVAWQGGWLKGEVSRKDKLEFLGMSVKISKQDKFIIGLPYQAKAEEVLKRTNSKGVVQYYKIKVKQRVYKTQYINGLDPKKVTPPESDWEQIIQEIALIKQAQAKVSELTAYDTRFIWPVIGRISGVYGSKRVLNGQERNPHYGVDIAAKKGTLVMAPAAGRVVLTHPNMYYSGGTLIIDHGHGIFSTFLHLQSIQVVPGNEVVQGQKIATVGNTGRAKGAHLDWRVNWGEHRLDGELFMSPMPKK